MQQRTAVDADIRVGMDGERALIVQLLRQALVDARSRRADIRDEARQFLQDPQATGVWITLAGGDPDAFQEQVQQVLQRTREV
jgi:hypothetical protein